MPFQGHLQGSRGHGKGSQSIPGGYRAHRDRLPAAGRSAKGTYITFDLSMVVESHERMKAMDEAIRAVEGVRMLL